MIKWDSGKFFPKIGKLLTPTIKDKNVTYFNLSLKSMNREKICRWFHISEKLYERFGFQASKETFTIAYRI